MTSTSWCYDNNERGTALKSKESVGGKREGIRLPSGIHLNSKLVISIASPAARVDSAARAACGQKFMFTFSYVFTFTFTFTFVRFRVLRAFLIAKDKEKRREE
jgi:hypothetical protein